MWAGSKFFRTRCHLWSTAPRGQGASRCPSSRAVTPLPPWVWHHVSGYFPRVASPSTDSPEFSSLLSPYNQRFFQSISSLPLHHVLILFPAKLVLSHSGQWMDISYTNRTTFLVPIFPTGGSGKRQRNSQHWKRT